MVLAFFKEPDMSMLKFIAAAALLASAAAQACESYELRVLPFEYAETRMPAVELSKAYGGGRFIFGHAIAKLRAAVDGCRIDVSYADAVMIVASELESDDCSLRLIRDHELQHIDIFRRSVERLSRELPATATAAEAQELLVAFNAAVAAEQQSIDTPREYSRARQECGGRVLALTGRR